MNKYTVDEKVINGVLSYLGTRPYTEVAGLVKAIVEGAKLTETETSTETTTEDSAELKAVSND